MTQGPQAYDIAKIRQLLTEAFTPEELRRFCLDRPLFQPVVDRFGPAHGLDDMVDEVSDYCRTQLLFAPLLAELQAANPRQYARHFGGASRPPGPEPAAHGRRLEIGELRVPGCSMRNMVLLLSLTLLLAASIGGASLMMGDGNRRATPPPIAQPPTPTHLPQPSAPVPEAGDTWVRPADGAVMVYVPAGEFLMGSTQAEVEDAVAACMAHDTEEDACRGWFQIEMPQHAVYLDAFWIDEHEVTNYQYRRCMEAGACQEPECWDSDRGNAPDQPVLCVSWHQASDYAAWAGGRLPAEAEWEKAARGTGGRIYPWGNDFDGSKLNFCDRNCAHEARDETADDGYARVAPVGSYPGGASPYGALDMAGNVYEWVADWYGEDYYQRSPLRNPVGPDSGTARVLRGGAWFFGRDFARCAARVFYSPDSRNSGFGFRVLVAVGQE